MENRQNIDSGGAEKGLSIVLDKYSRTPIYEQIIEQFKKLMLTEELAADDPMPSVRSLSVELSVNPNTLQKAYTELERQGLSYSIAGNGRFVHPQAKKRLQQSETTEAYASLEQLMQFLLTAGQQPTEIMTRVKEILTKQTAGKETIEK